jgi:hypothetical protein
MRDHRRRYFSTSLIACVMMMPMTGEAAGAAAPPTSPATEAKYAGCVQHLSTDKDTLVISGETFCAKLNGKFSAANLDGHEVELKGVLTERSPGVPASISVGFVITVGKSCSNTCSLLPPTRGLGKGGEIPGKEGGTPGAAPVQPPAPQ